MQDKKQQHSRWNNFRDRAKINNFSKWVKKENFIKPYKDWEPEEQPKQPESESKKPEPTETKK